MLPLSWLFSIFIILYLFICSAWDGFQGLTYAQQAFYHWAAPLVLDAIILKGGNLLQRACIFDHRNQLSKTGTDLCPTLTLLLNWKVLPSRNELIILRCCLNQARRLSSLFQLASHHILVSPDPWLTIVGDVQAGDVVDLGNAALQDLCTSRPQLRNKPTQSQASTPLEGHQSTKNRTGGHKTSQRKSTHPSTPKIYSPQHRDAAVSAPGNVAFHPNTFRKRGRLQRLPEQGGVSQHVLLPLWVKARSLMVPDRMQRPCKWLLCLLLRQDDRGKCVHVQNRQIKNRYFQSVVGWLLGCRPQSHRVPILLSGLPNALTGHLPHAPSPSQDPCNCAPAPSFLLAWTESAQNSRVNVWESLVVIVGLLHLITKLSAFPSLWLSKSFW